MAERTTDRRRILHTEDHADTRDVIAFTLELAGHEVVSTASPSYALLLAKTESFDLFIIDNWLPEMSGIQLIRKLREFNRTTPILFYTGFGLPEEERNARSAGAQVYLVKPIDNDDLISEVARLTAEAKPAASSSPNDFPAIQPLI